MSLRLEILEMDREIEAEGEEGNNDEVDETDAGGWNNGIRIERSEIVHAESNCWRNSLRDSLQVRQYSGIVLGFGEYGRGPRFSHTCGSLGEKR